MDCTQYGLYNLKQYDHNQILNGWVHITLLHTINICAEWKLCMKITIHKKHKHIYKYIKQERIKSQLVNLFQKVYYDTWSNGILFITQDESSPPAPFHLSASKVMLVSTPLWRWGEVKKHYAPIRTCIKYPPKRPLRFDFA